MFGLGEYIHIYIYIWEVCEQRRANTYIYIYIYIYISLYNLIAWRVCLFASACPHICMQCAGATYVGAEADAPAITEATVVFMHHAPRSLRRTSRHAGKQARRHAGRHACMQAGMQASRQAGMQAGRQAIKHASKQTCMQASIVVCRIEYVLVWHDSVSSAWDVWDV